VIAVDSVDYLYGDAVFKGGNGNDEVAQTLADDATFDGGNGDDFVKAIQSGSNSSFFGRNGCDSVENDYSIGAATVDLGPERGCP
jgi:hypothetical protein